MKTPIPRLVARTVEIDDPGPLLDLLTADSPMTWIRRGEGFITSGVAAEFRPAGKSRFDEASSWWHEVVRVAAVADEVGVAGTGLIALASFAFADQPGDSVITVPSLVIGRRGEHCWLTTISEIPVPAAVLKPQPLPEPPADLAYTDGALSAEAWADVVGQAVAQLNAGELDKVVLARDLIATASAPIDVRWPLRRLGADYDMCWTFHVDGLFGATPELLVRREKGLVTSRVLAGTIRRTGNDEHDLRLAATLARSSKDLEEHEYAVRSVADALAPYCSSMNVPEAPFVLHLPNVMHLATDVAAVAHNTGASVLDLAAALHPSAAVGGTPTKLAVELITEIEGMDRGRYAGPVGWVDATGDGEFGIALRSGQLEGNQVRLFAGCGIVAGSDPQAELAESRAKFVPVQDSLAR